MPRAFFRLILAVFALSSAPVYAALPPVEDFGTLPQMSGVSVSPSGRYIATIQAVDLQTVLAVYDTSTNARIATVPSGKAKIRNVRWYSDDRMLVLVGQIQEVFIPGRDIIYEECRVLSMKPDGSNPLALGCAGTSILSLKGPEPDTILMAGFNFQSKDGSANKTGARETTNVYSVNIVTGDVKEIEKGVKNTQAYVADKNGVVRMRINVFGGRAVYQARLPGSTDWVEVGSNTIIEFEQDERAAAANMTFTGFADNPNEAYVSFRDGDKQVLAVYDLAARKVTRTVLKDAKWDADGFIQDRFGRVIGGNITRWRPEQEFFAPEYQQLQRELEANFPGHYVRLQGISDDQKQVVAYVEGPQAPGGAYQFVDFAKGDGFNIGFRYPKLTKDKVGAVQEITYKARDGLPIDAYLTIPAGTSGKNMPAIVMPHGGPQARDSGTFDWWSQFLASRGYVILQPQYRGSDGYGRAFADAGRYQWGMKMQDDVSDGVKYMVEMGIADPKRVCILGWSYGGYAAMAGATLTPELYRCSVAGAGVSDLLAMLNYVGRFDAASFASRYWKKHIGDRSKDLARIKATSPANFVDRVAAPLQLIHGKQDTVVPIEQSEIMDRAMKAAGKPVEFVVLDGEDHNLSFTKTRVAALKAMEAFLLKHNPPN
jgi:dipeptidyl aminopeptidase/acylaminoacyl peptidase